MTTVDSCAATTPADEVFAATLPGAAYTDPAVLDCENERIFEREWIMVARADDLPNAGDVRRVQVGRESVILVRGRRGELRAFLNVCRHRGASLCRTDSENVGKAIRCPYHAWTYGLDGSLITTPNWEAMQAVDKSSMGLNDARVEVWWGMVWVCLDPDTAPLESLLAPQLEFRLGPDAAETLGRYEIGSLVVGERIVYEVEANWKLIMENFQECYHCGTIHPELVDAIPAFQDPGLATHGYDIGGYGFGDGRDGFTASGRRQLPRLPGLRLDDDLKYFGMVLRPNAFLSLTPDHAITHRFEAISPTRTRAVCEWLVRPEVAADPSYDLSDTVSIFHTVNRQDFAAAEWCQPNMSSRSYRDGGVLAPTEQLLIGRWYAWYHEAMGASR